MLGCTDVLGHEIQVRGAGRPSRAHEASREFQDIGGRGAGRRSVGLLTLRRLILGPSGDDERLELALAERRHRAELGFDAIGCPADANGHIVVANPCVAEDVERRDEPVGGREPQQAVAQAIGPPAQLDAAIVDDVDPSV